MDINPDNKKINAKTNKIKLNISINSKKIKKFDAIHPTLRHKTNRIKHRTVHKKLLSLFCQQARPVMSKVLLQGYVTKFIFKSQVRLNMQIWSKYVIIKV